MKIDRLLAWFTRRTSTLPIAWQLTERWRKHYTEMYKNVADPWVVINDFDGSLKLKIDRSAYLGGLLYWRGYQSPSDLRLLARILKPEMVVVDVGANQGEYTLFAAKRLKKGHVLAFEPVAQIYKQLIENINLNGFSNVTAINCGLLDDVGERPMYTSTDQVLHGSFNEGLASVFASDYRSEPVARVVFRTLDDVVKEYALERVDMIKIDVEGAEMLVLRGAQEVIRRYHPMLLMEVNADALAAAGHSAQDLLEFLRQMGYQIARVNVDGSTTDVTNEQIPRLCDVLCVWR